MITIAIPCFNAMATVAETIESAIAQDVEKEIIVIDDGSTDETPSIVKSFGSAVRYVATPNRGVSAARALATDEARGTFIQYLDSDDVLLPATLQLRLEALMATAADIAHTDYQKIHVSTDGVVTQGEIMVSNVAALDEDSEVATATSRFWAPPAALLYRRELIDRMGRWHPHLPIIQDARFLFDATLHGARFVHVPGVGALYRVMPNSLSRRRRQFISDCCLNATEIENIWRSRGELSSRQSQAIRGIWEHIARAALFSGFPEFEDALCGYKRNQGRNTMLEIMPALRKMLGVEATATLLNTLRRLKPKH